ncbi:MAG: ABC transporter permease, partial [Pseudomonadota bacterium]
MATASAIAEEPKFLALLFSRRSVFVALSVFLVIVVLCAFAQIVSPADPAKMSVRARLTPPGPDFLLGADAFGRDVFARILYAGRVSLTIGLGVAALASVIGIA